MKPQKAEEQPDLFILTKADMENESFPGNRNVLVWEYKLVNRPKTFGSQKAEENQFLNNLKLLTLVGA